MVVGVGGPPRDPEGEGTCCIGEPIGGRILRVLIPLLSGAEVVVMPLKCDCVMMTGECVVNEPGDWC